MRNQNRLRAYRENFQSVLSLEISGIPGRLEIFLSQFRGRNTLATAAFPRNSSQVSDKIRLNLLHYLSMIRYPTTTIPSTLGKDTLGKDTRQAP